MKVSGPAVYRLSLIGPCIAFYLLKLAPLVFRCVNVCLCVQLRLDGCVSAQQALLGSCLTSYLLPSLRGALVSVWPCRAILPLAHTHHDPIGPQHSELNHTHTQIERFVFPAKQMGN